MRYSFVGSLVMAAALASTVCGPSEAVGQQAQATDPPAPAPQQTALGLADIKALSKAGVSDEVIISQIRNSHSAYHLNTASIIDLKEAGVGEKVIDFMINVPSPSPSPLEQTPAPAPRSPAPTSPPSSMAAEPQGTVVVAQAPPSPIVEQVVDPPGRDYVWISGYWTWDGVRWLWIGGRWARPPHRHALWVSGRWEIHGGRWVWISGYWR